MLFLNRIFKTHVLVMLLFLICLTKSIVSYTEELFLLALYICLFSIILHISGNVLRIYIISDVVKIIEFYENMVYVTMLLYVNIQKIYNLIKVTVYSKFQINVLNYTLKKKKQFLKIFNLKLKFNYFCLFLSDVILNLNRNNLILRS